jgi:methionyl-tRNA formyltransferase
MSVVFFGFQTWGLVTLRAIVASGREVSLVVTHPEAQLDVNRHFTDSVAEFAKSHDIPVLVRTKADEEVIGLTRESAPTFVVSSNWRRKIPAEILSVASQAAINVHRSLLPRYAGLAPLNWAIAKGETQVGVTMHLMEPEIDAGDILGQEVLDIGPDETATEVFHRLNPLVASLAVRVLRDFECSTVHRTKQDRMRTEFFHARGERELELNWMADRAAVYNLIRAQSDPFANAFCVVEGRRITIKRARLPDGCFRGTPSRVVDAVPKGSAIVLCGASHASACQGIEILDVAVDNGPVLAAGSVLQSGQYLAASGR